MNNVFSENCFIKNDYFFDFNNNIFKVSDEDISLDPIEIKILRTLTDNPGMVIDSALLITFIWRDTDYAGSSRLHKKMDALISKLSAEEQIKYDGTGYMWLRR